MFQRRVTVEYVAADGSLTPCQIKWIDSFAMRNFTNNAIFDDTLPVTDGLMEIGNRVPVADLQSAMADWFRRKGYLRREETLHVEEIPSTRAAVPLKS